MKISIQKWLKGHITQSTILVLSLISEFHASAIDIVRISQGQSAKDVRALYTHQVLSKALALTEGSYGAYKVEVTSKGGFWGFSPLKRHNPL